MGQAVRDLDPNLFQVLQLVAVPLDIGIQRLLAESDLEFAAADHTIQLRTTITPITGTFLEDMSPCWHHECPAGAGIRLPQGEGDLQAGIRREEGRGSGTQNPVHQKWPAQFFSIVNFVFSHNGHFGLGGGGRGGGGGAGMY